MVAERVATLDVLSNGRCEFGAGRGTAAYVVEGLGFNADADHARAVGREALEAVVQMLEQEHFPGYKSAYFDLPPRQVVPRPIQRPHPPLWYAASNLETFERAGAAGVGVLGVTRYTHAEIKPHVEAYRAAIRAADPARVVGRFVNDHVGVFAIGLRARRRPDRPRRRLRRRALLLWRQRCGAEPRAVRLVRGRGADQGADAGLLE
jgi:alkanesulfonate monooxygenase SsuD/methylene tetrahydromethanopterin reductase-like flavin-dependent oxidoreductase (luciferase family)